MLSLMYSVIHQLFLSLLCTRLGDTELSKRASAHPHGVDSTEGKREVKQ